MSTVTLTDYNATANVLYEKPTKQSLEQLLVRCHRTGDSTDLLVGLYSALLKAHNKLQKLRDKTAWADERAWTEEFLNTTCALYRAQGALAVALTFLETEQDPNKGLLALRIEGVIETLRRATEEGKITYPYPDVFNTLTLVNMLLGEAPLYKPAVDGVLPLPQVKSPVKPKRLTLRKRKR